MKNLEKSYYDQMVPIKVPYESLPEYPPKPFQNTRRNISLLKFYSINE